jgi:Cu(I)/Ag(I) efflux system membrane fusion protein
MTARKIVIVVILVVLVGAGGGLIGYFTGHGAESPATAATTDAKPKRKVAYWVAPMNPNYRRDKPGKSPMGMDLIPVYADGGGGNADVKISPTVVNDLGVRMAKVKQGTLARRIETVGYVDYNQDTLRSIHSRAEGWIEKLAIESEGDRVAAGQLLYELFSPKLATAEQEYLTARASGSKSLAASSRARLAALGFTRAQIDRLRKDKTIDNRVARRAHQSGLVVKLGVREGAYVTPSTEIMKLADLDSVWILVEVDASRAGSVAKGQTAIAHLDAYPGKTWKGRVDYIYPKVSPVTRTLKVRLRFPNPKRRLKPGMYAHVAILAAPQNAVYIPVQALIRTGHSQRVVVALGEGHFDVCPVEAGFSSGDKVQILKGLQPGQRVVVSSQFLIDSEANINAAALRLGAGKAGCGAPAKKAESSMPGMRMPPNPSGDETKGVHS